MMRGQYNVQQRARGFTLVEVLVAIVIMATMAVMSWRGLQTMWLTQARLQQRADEVQVMQTALAQWRTDWNKLAELPGLSTWAWDGKVLRLTREGLTAQEGLRVVAWSWRQDTAAPGYWLRWQSEAVTSPQAWQQAWDQAQVWSQTPTQALRRWEVPLLAMEGWALYVYQGGSWTNPLSSAAQNSPTQADAGVNEAGAADAASASGVAGATGGMGGSNAAADNPNTERRPPDAVRLVLNGLSDQALTGQLSMDWIRPTFSGSGS